VSQTADYDELPEDGLPRYEGLSGSEDAGVGLRRDRLMDVVDEADPVEDG
jgi:hypothetical protein